ncbi:MAG: hypothetical protein WC285_00410 [Candidatus Gracilibacteria bacterium]|jgi:hypothetical protein
MTKNVKMLLGVLVAVVVLAAGLLVANPSLLQGRLVPIPTTVVSDSYFNFLRSPDGAGEPIAFFNVVFAKKTGNAFFQMVDEANNVVVSTPHSCVPFGVAPSKRFTCQFHFLVGSYEEGSSYEDYSEAPIGKYKVRVFYGKGNDSLTPAQITAQPSFDSPLVGYGL